MADITVFGAGAFGLSVAFECARRGAKVRVIERRAVGAGSSGGIVGALAPHTPENWNPKKAFQFDSLIMAADFWGAVEHVGGETAGYARSGRVQPIADDHALSLAMERAENARSLWQGLAEWHVVDAADMDWAPPSPTGKVIHDTLSARLYPARACAALAAAIRALGGEILIGDHDAARGSAVVWATGYEGLEHLTANHTRSMGAGVKGQAALLAFDRRDLPQLFADTLHFIPHYDGTLAIGSTSEREFTDPTGNDALVEDLIARARAAVPDLRDAKVIRIWAGVRPRARSRAPMIGPYPGKPGHYIANGGFKIGFGMAPKVAAVMADLILNDHDTIPDPFRVEANF